MNRTMWTKWPWLALFAATAACGAGAPSDSTTASLDAGMGANDSTATPDSGGGGASDSSSAPIDSTMSASDSTSATDAGAPAVDAGSTKYDRDGTEPYTMSSVQVMTNSDSFTLNLFVPSSAGPHPVVSFSSGTQQPASAYTTYATRLASWGFVVLTRDDPGLLTVTDTIVSDLTYLVGTWLPAQNAADAGTLSGKLDLAHVGLTGHSRGGAATLIALEMGLKGKAEAWFGLDPVDESFAGQNTYARTDMSALDVSTTFLGGGVSTNCSPTDASYELLYGLAPSPTVAITAVNASHTEFEDPAGCFACAVCTPMGSANPTTVVAFSERYMTAFFARELLGDTSVGPEFQGAGAPADVANGLVMITSK